MGGERESVGSEPDLLTDPDEVAKKEAENAVRQFDAVLDLIDEVARDGRSFKLRPSIILSLHKLALDELSRYAGTWRPSSVAIEKSKHKPPHESDVPRLIEEMCDYVNDNWDELSALEICAYLMWRLNWIHPFLDGNGRTSRAVSYLAMCAKIGDRLPGTQTIPEQIAAGRQPYYDALESADNSWSNGTLDVTEMEGLLKHYFSVQLASTFEQADTSGAIEQKNPKFH